MVVTKVSPISWTKTHITQIWSRQFSMSNNSPECSQLGASTRIPFQKMKNWRKKLSKCDGGRYSLTNASNPTNYGSPVASIRGLMSVHSNQILNGKHPFSNAMFGHRRGFSEWLSFRNLSPIGCFFSLLVRLRNCGNLTHPSDRSPDVGFRSIYTTNCLYLRHIINHCLHFQMSSISMHWILNINHLIDIGTFIVWNIRRSVLRIHRSN